MTKSINANSGRQLVLGMAALVLLASATVSQATVVVVQDFEIPTSGTSHDYEATEFGVSVGGEISGITLNLNNTGASAVNASIFIYDLGAISDAASKPTGSATSLGTISMTPGIHQDSILSSTLSTDNYNLIASHDYSLVVQFTDATSQKWEYVTWASGNNTGDLNAGTIVDGGAYNGDNGTSWADGGNTTSQERELEIDVVPESNITAAFMCFGGLAIASGHMLRRKAGASAKG